MLFDLRGRGRRRAIQAIYLSLAILMGGGLVFFGIGGNTSGGLFDAIGGSSGSSSNADTVFNQRVATLEQRTRANPQDAAAYAGLAKLHFQLAGTNLDQSQQAYTEKGRQELVKASRSWERYLALEPAKPDAATANLMVQAYGQIGLKRYDKAVQAMEIVIDARPPAPGLYAQLAILAAAAKQDRKSTLAEDKAVALAPKDQRKSLKDQIDLAKTQLTAQPQATPQTG